MRDCSPQKVMANENVEIYVNTTVYMSPKNIVNRPNIMIRGEKRGEVVPIKIGITSPDRWPEVKTGGGRNTMCS